MIVAGRMDHGDTNGNGGIEERDRKTLVVLNLEHRQDWALVPEVDAAFGRVDWTADGRWIIASFRVNGINDIYRIHLDGAGMENLTKNVGELLGAGRPHLFSDASVSFDGNWIVFLYAESRDQPSRIVLMKLDGSEARFTESRVAPSRR